MLALTSMPLSTSIRPLFLPAPCLYFARLLTAPMNGSQRCFFHAPLLTDCRLESWKPMASEADSSSKQWARNGPLTKDHHG
jgi:hypothetical protein